MFSDETLEKILSKDVIIKLPFETRSEVIHAIEDVLEEEQLAKGDNNDGLL